MVFTMDLHEYKTCTVLFLSSYKKHKWKFEKTRMLWEHELHVSVSAAFSSSPKFPKVFL